jgi:hypothetical protein
MRRQRPCGQRNSLKYLANIGTHRRNKDWEHFLIWNEFETEARPKDEKKSSSRKSSTPRSGKIKRRVISPLEVEHRPCSGCRGPKGA